MFYIGAQSPRRRRGQWGEEEGAGRGAVAGPHKVAVRQVGVEGVDGNRNAVGIGRVAGGMWQIVILWFR
jgi:hypothetical protein